eukprot:symbB.v1.2.003674.t2/scaffold175.1/size369221/30
MAASMGISFLLWIIGLFVLLFKGLSECPEVKSWLRFMMWLRALMPMLVLCCIIPIQQLCCEAHVKTCCWRAVILGYMFWWPGVATSPKGLLQLQVRCDSTKPGEDLAVAGDAPLPGWRGGKPRSMICQDPVSGETYWPDWKLAEPLEVEVGQELHYKYVLVRGTKKDKLKWEADGLGNHRRLLVTEELLRAGFWDDGQFGDIPGVERSPKRERKDREAKTRTQTDVKEEMVNEFPKELSLPSHDRLRQVGKGKQGACFLVDLAEGQAVLKEFSGGRNAFRAEVWALQELEDTDAVKQGAIPAFLGADREKRRVMMRSKETCSYGFLSSMSQVTFSLLSSAFLALAWQRGQAPVKDGETKEFQLERLLLAPMMAIRHSNQVLPTLLVFYAASSFSAVLLSGFSLGLCLEQGGWLGLEDVKWDRALAIHLAVCIWRADKMETLFQRMQRSVKIIQSSGVGVSLKNSLAEPWSWFWPGFWGSARRFALIAVSYLGYGSFVRSALPAVVFDECLWWLLSKTQDLFSRKAGVCVPHDLRLGALTVFLLAFFAYPDHDQYPILLVTSALAWTGHNCQLLSYFQGVKLPDADLAPALDKSNDQLFRALLCWLHVATAVEEANRNEVYHCDVNPWNVLCAEDLKEANVAQGCLVDWACSTTAKAPKLQRRGDFQAGELLEGHVGPHTDVYGCASTLLWLLLKRTRKGLPERSASSLLEHFREDRDKGPELLEPLARACSWGMEEDVKDRCPVLGPLLELVNSATQQMEQKEHQLCTQLHLSAMWKLQLGTGACVRNSGVCFNLSLNGCGQASCFSSISALHGLAEAADRKESSSDASDLESLSSSSTARPMVLSFAPGWWGPPEMSLLNDFRMAMDELLASPEQETADIASNAYQDLMSAVQQQKVRWKGTQDENTFLPDADYDIRKEKLQVQARLVPPPCGNLELFEVAGAHAHARTHARPEAFAVEHEGSQEKFRASPAWLRSLSSLARRDLEGDLQILREKFGLDVAELTETRKNGLPSGLAVDLLGAAQAVEAAKSELVEGILQYYATQVEWSAAELPAEPDEDAAMMCRCAIASSSQVISLQEPPTRSVSVKRSDNKPTQDDASTEPAPEPSEPWGEAPTAGEVAWGDAPEAAEVSWESPGQELLPGLREALRSVNMEHLALRIETWAEENGAVSLREVIDNLDMFLEEVSLDAADAQRLPLATQLSRSQHESARYRQHTPDCPGTVLTSLEDLEIYSFYGLSHWLSEVDDLLAQIDQVSIATPKPQELALVERKEELLAAQTQLRRQMGALLEEPLTRRERPKAEEFLEAQLHKLQSQANKEKIAGPVGRLQELLAKLKGTTPALESKSVRDIEAQMKQADAQWNELEPIYAKWQAGRHSFKSNAELQAFKRRYEEAKKVRATAPQRLEEALRGRRTGTAPAAAAAAPPSAGWAAVRTPPKAVAVNTVRGAAAVALDKPKASAKSPWTSGVTMAQRLRAEAAAQVRGAQASQPDAEQKAVEKAEDEDDLFWEELMPYSIPNAAFFFASKRTRLCQFGVPPVAPKRTSLASMANGGRRWGPKVEEAEAEESEPERLQEPVQEEKSLEREKTFTASAKKKSKKKRKGEATEDVDVVESTTAPESTSLVQTLQAAVADTVLEELLCRESWTFDEKEAQSRLASHADRLLHSPLGFCLPFSWSSFMALDLDGGPKRRSRRGQSDALERLRFNVPRLSPFYLTMIFFLVILHSLSHFGFLLWIMALQTALLLLPCGLHNFKTSAHVQVLQVLHLLLWLFFVRALWQMHIFIKIFCAPRRSEDGSWMNQVLADSEVAMVVGHAYSVSEMQATDES